MLYLQPCIHFQKIETLVLAHHELHRAGALVLHGFGKQHGLLPHGFSRRVSDERRRRFFNHFLVAALDGAFALIEVDHVALAVTNQLDLDVTRFFDKLFDEHPIITKAVARLIAATGKAIKRLLVVAGHTQALATATGGRLDHHRVANALGNFNSSLRRFNCIVNARYAIDTGSASQFFRFNLVAHGSD